MDKTRRRVLQMAAVSVLGSFAAPLAQAARHPPGERAIAFQNLHTGESLSTVYWADGRYLPEAMQRIDWLLRDFRVDQAHPIDPRLLDTLAGLRHRLYTQEPLQVISGYRSPSTNEMLARMSGEVAHHSLHTQGMAVDIRVPGRRLSGVRTAAMGLRRGGVGYYPRSNFVHIDVGPVRHW